MDKPYDHYVAQQERKAEQLEARIRADERERIIALLNHEYWHNISHLSDIHYDCLMCEAIALIKGDN